jgi:UDP-N-acetylglucosamine--N-acetylmuramyl-(pentapeptide) pyrophosphoryl-undecaprenol N-acetylglucosamine transferase
MNGVEVKPFIDDMAAAYNWADLVIARAGAATVSELAAIGLASILVPYPQAVDDHQTKNAAYLEKGGAARVIAESNIAHLETLLTPAFLQREALLAMAQAAYALGRKDATHIIVEECLGVLGAK